MKNHSTRRSCYIISYQGTKPKFDEPQTLWTYDHRSALLVFGKNAVQLIFYQYQYRSSIDITKGTVSWFSHSKKGRVVLDNMEKKHLVVYNAEDNSFTLKYNTTAFKFVVSEPVKDIVIPTYGHPRAVEETKEEKEDFAAAEEHIRELYYEI